jgi:hypothetical protein
MRLYKAGNSLAQFRREQQSMTDSELKGLYEHLSREKAGLLRSLRAHQETGPGSVSLLAKRNEEAIRFLLREKQHYETRLSRAQDLDYQRDLAEQLLKAGQTKEALVKEVARLNYQLRLSKSPSQALPVPPEKKLNEMRQMIKTCEGDNCRLRKQIAAQEAKLEELARLTNRKKERLEQLVGSVKDLRDPQAEQRQANHARLQREIMRGKARAR